MQVLHSYGDNYNIQQAQKTRQKIKKRKRWKAGIYANSWTRTYTSSVAHNKGSVVFVRFPSKITGQRYASQHTIYQKGKDSKVGWRHTSSPKHPNWLRETCKSHNTHTDPSKQQQTPQNRREQEPKEWPHVSYHSNHKAWLRQQNCLPSQEVLSRQHVQFNKSHLSRNQAEQSAYFSSPLWTQDGCMSA